MSLALSKEDIEDSKIENPVKLKIDSASDVSDDDDDIENIDQDEDDESELAEEEADEQDSSSEEEADEENEGEDSKLSSQSKSTTLSEMLQNVSYPDSDKKDSIGDEDEDEDDEDDDDDRDENYLQKFNNDMIKDYVIDFHPEQKIHDHNEVVKLSKVTRDKSGQITDPFHKTTPILSKYEKTKVLGQRAKQIDEGCKSFVNAAPSTLDGYIIALEELNQRKLPFIIRRPIPNGGVEYWPVKELEIIN